MPRDYNLNISVEGGNRRGAFGGGNISKTKTTLNSKSSFNADGEDKSNLEKLFTIGMAFNKGQQANELVGAYTENRLRQRKIETGMTFAKYAIGIGLNPLIGGVYAGGDLLYRGIGYSINIQKQNKEARYYRGLSGNNANSGRRYKGDYV